MIIPQLIVRRRLTARCEGRQNERENGYERLFSSISAVYACECLTTAVHCSQRACRYTAGEYNRTKYIEFDILYTNQVILNSM